jgi:hypothetical protein
VELGKQRKKLGCELKARFYLYNNAKFIVCSVAGISETGEPTVLPLDVSDSDLGRCVCDHLLQFNPKSPEYRRGEKRSDWPAYEISGAKSMRRFEEKSLMVRFETINLVIRIDAAPRNSLWREISAHGVEHPDHEKLGRTIRRTIKAARILRENGII